MIGRWAVLAVLLVATTMASCTDEPEPAPPVGVATPVASPSPSQDAPSPAPLPSPTPAPSSTPSTPSTPSPSAAPAADAEAALTAARDRRAERDDCDAGFADEAHSIVAEVDGQLLVYVVCFVGAYQPSGELRVWDGTELRAVPVEQWQFGEVLDTAEVVGAVEASPEGTEVTNDVKYRGLGDCGLRQRWAFDGSSLMLTEAREQECDDDGEFVPPSEWPVVYDR